MLIIIALLVFAILMVMCRKAIVPIFVIGFLLYQFGSWLPDTMATSTPAAAIAAANDDGTTPVGAGQDAIDRANADVLVQLCQSGDTDALTKTITDEADRNSIDRVDVPIMEDGQCIANAYRKNGKQTTIRATYKDGYIIGSLDDKPRYHSWAEVSAQTNKEEAEEKAQRDAALAALGPDDNTPEYAQKYCANEALGGGKVCDTAERLGVSLKEAASVIGMDHMLNTRTFLDRWLP